jgi:SAM-dependent methyltransferase
VKAVEPAAPSPLLERHREDLRAARRRGPIVDLACGRGRNALAIARGGLPVVGIDRNPDFLASLRASARAESLPVSLGRADLEATTGPALAPQSCGAIAVFRFLHRPLCRALVSALRPGGLLLYETFTIHQRDLGHGPENPAFLLEDDELPSLFPELEVLAHWEGTIVGPKTWAVAQLVARRARSPTRDSR